MNRTSLSVALAALAFGSTFPQRALAQWTTRQVTACTDTYVDLSACGRFAISTRASLRGYGTDLRVWLANLSGAPGIPNVGAGSFSSVFNLEAFFRTAHGTAIEDYHAPQMTPQGTGATRLTAGVSYTTLNGDGVRLFTESLTHGNYAGIGGCSPGGAGLNGSIVANSLATCGEGNWATYDFWTFANWNAAATTSMSFNIYVDDRVSIQTGEWCIRGDFAGTHVERCRFIEDRSFDGLPNVSTVPEPASLALLATGLLGVGLVARRPRRPTT